ncbi:fungal-specific transcription factor domain-containing protein [Dactylonectria estremocensis]|uniref:Fungal-specific transcription factor domain-containing protein n=1 Tax=Dactylonectria estremocensis TaxID=1079267 RepID=A0A9P9E241_9HYPO|nr:fungal-specific transcription factor domain-containing protein [Dactylonectria estremocensis]
MLTVGEKSFACTHQGCTKRFTRAEHLHRHALNHTSGGSTCTLCRAHFKRPDLLKRHMDRHRQKDLEAGGPGHGVLDTRKRSWKAPDGSVVEKRPCTYSSSQRRSSTERVQSQAQQEPSPEPESTELDEYVDQSFAPPTIQNIDESGPIVLDIRSGHANTATGPEPIGSLSFPGAAASSQQQDSTLLYNQSWTELLQSRTIEDPFSSPEQLQYDRIFQPDTASSFNMPYTTALDYNWLFNVEKSPAAFGGSESAHSPEFFAQDFQGMNMQAGLAITPESMGTSQLWSETIDTDPREPRNQEQPYMDINNHPPAQRMMHHPARPVSADVYPERGPRRRLADGSAGTQNNRAGAHAIPIEFERPLSTLRKPLPLPVLTEVIRERLLKIIDRANPSLPDQRHSIWDHPLLSVDSLQSYLELYFTRFNTAYPLIHLATFNVHEDEPLLLLSVLLLGATYSTKDAHQLAVCIHDVIRPSIFAHTGFSPRPELWTLQTILLVECFGKSRAGQKQHDMSHLFHGLLINLIRRSDCQSIRPVGPPQGSGEDNIEGLDRIWRRWAEAESKKRLALLCFMWDTQHAVLFCQSLCMSSFELRLELPCSQSIWEARDPTSWVSAWRSTLSADHRTLYLPTLKTYLSSKMPRPTGLGALSRMLILHGLMSIAWDMQRRDQTSLGVVSEGGGDVCWRKMISTAYDLWKVDFDWYCAAVTSRFQRGSQGQQAGREDSVTEEETQRSEFLAFAAAYNAVYHSAQVLLNVDFLDIQIYAGARHILGRPVQQRDYLRSAQIVKRWAATTNSLRASSGEASSTDGKDSATTPSSEQQPAQPNQSAATAAWHAARMLRDTMRVLIDSEAMNLFHVPWCLYLVTLTCWAFHHARPNRSRRTSSRMTHATSDDDDEDAYNEDDEMVWDPKAEMQSLLTSMSEGMNRSESTLAWERRRTNGLVWIMADSLTKVRWGIVHSGVVVLRGLVPQRLINQYDEFDD